MPISNAQVVKDFIEAGNKGDIGRMRALCTPDFVAKGSPYVGCGFSTDESNGRQLFVRNTINGAPSSGKLMPGDEILSVREGGRSYTGFKELKNNPWGQGIPGTDVEFHLRRAGKEIDVTVTRGKIPAYTMSFDTIEPMLKAFFAECPDHREEIERIVEQGEYVTVLSTMQATFPDFGRGAFWNACYLYRVRDGKVAENQGIEDGLAQYKQLGYSITEPAKAAR